jgi:hypothetical protein
MPTYRGKAVYLALLTLEDGRLMEVETVEADDGEPFLVPNWLTDAETGDRSPERIIPVRQFSPRRMPEAAPQRIELTVPVPFALLFGDDPATDFPDFECVLAALRVRQTRGGTH